MMQRADDIDLTSFPDLGIVIDLDRGQGRLALLQVQFGHQVAIPLVHIDRARMDPAEGRGFVHLFQALKVAAAIYQADGLAADAADADMLGWIGRLPVIPLIMVRFVGHNALLLQADHRLYKASSKMSLIFK